MVAATVAVAINASFVILIVFIRVFLLLALLLVRCFQFAAGCSGYVASGYRPRCYRSQHQDKPTEITAPHAWKS
jgi:hypothetical protein